MANFYQWQQQTLYLNVHIQPRASKDELCGLYNQRLKIRLKSPPVDGQANRQLIQFLAQLFAVPKSAVTLLNGETSRDKRLSIQQPHTLPDVIAHA